MKRHAALQDLSRDHQLMLMQARHIRWLEEGHPRATSFDAVLAGLLAFWASEGEAHLLEEETVLLPALAALPDLAQRMLKDYAELRNAIAQLQAHPDTGVLFAFGRHLNDHVRWEERSFFEETQAHLSEAQLASIGRHSREFRMRHDRPVGPYSTTCAVSTRTRATQRMAK